jgi:protoporphyrinogen/coproporphyrinogen III oxidase
VAESATPPLPIAVIGGGATGLAAAYALSRRGHRVRLFESTDRLGGAILTERTADGWLIEAGPNSLLLGDASVRALFEELGLNPDLQAANPAARNRYLMRGGRVLPVPMSPGSFFSTPLFSAGAKLRLFCELFKGRRVRTTDVSLAQLVESHLSREWVTYALQPFISGVYAGNPERLSARYAFPPLWEAERTHGSLLRGQMAAGKARRARGEPKPGIVSFREGLQTIPRALAGRLPPGSIELGARIQSLLADKVWKVIWSREGTTTTEEFAAVVLALPGYALARLTVGPLGERPLAPLEAVEFPPVASLFLGYRREQVAHPLDGFGLLVAAAERRELLGVLFSSSLFPGRAPEGHVALTVMLGGALRPDQAHLNTESALERVKGELASLLGVTGDPVIVRHHVWPRAIPQYNLGHERFLEAMDRTEQQHPGLIVGGNTRDGIALTACLAAGLRLADRAEAAARRRRTG